jgi:hypothetical protein
MGMVGEREIMINVLLLPEMSRAERAGREKKTNNSHCPALRRRRRGEAAPSGEAASCLHWKGKVRFIARYRLYPASRVSGRGPAGFKLGKPKLLLYSIVQGGTYRVVPSTYYKPESRFQMHSGCSATYLTDSGI